ncbi:MAG TPA: MFS transporter [Pseudonocardiaceae bacterium]|nr:MFS transporter [Pseudonocardiaceae bacterium]
MTSSETAGHQPRAGRREWLGLAVIALPCIIYAMDFTVLHLAVPRLTEALQPSSVQLLWIVDIYGFLLSGSLITMGILGDRLGRRKLLLIGAAIFAVVSVFAAYASSSIELIVARGVLGVAAATLAPSTLSLIRNMFFDPKQRSVAIGVWVASFAGGTAIGPLVGGALLAHFWWGSVFLISVPPMVLLLALGPFLLPEYRDRKAGRIDLPSVAMSLVAVLAVVYGIKQIAENGFSGVSLAAILLGLAVAVVTIYRQRRLAEPLIDLKLFGSPAFSTTLVINLLTFSVTFAAFFFITQYLQLVLGLGPLTAGLWTLPLSVTQIIGSLLAPRIQRRFRSSTVIAAGLLLAALGFTVVAQVGDSSSNDLWLIVVGSVIFSFGLIQVITLATDLMVGSVPPERAGAASGLSESSSDFGGSLGIALLGSAAAVLYRGQVVDFIPHALPPHVADVSRDTLAGALSVAGQVPAATGRVLVSGARTAFTDATGLGFSLCAIVALAAALAAALFLRRHEVTAADEPEGVAPADTAEALSVPGQDMSATQG